MTVSNTSRQNDRQSERGNVLFLILIAVALFAALSYAVTQSTRSGGGDASKETNLVNAAGITQYPASIKTAITRMIVSNSVTPEELIFDTPSTFGAIEASSSPEDDKKRAVFYPTGGGATYVQAPASVMKIEGPWHFNGNNRVKNIGTTEGSLSANDADIIAFLPNVRKEVCDSIHDKLGIPKTYAILTVDQTSDKDFADDAIDVTGGGTITSPELDGQPQGCFRSAADVYVYYHVVVER